MKNIVLLILLIFHNYSFAFNKYSEKANKKLDPNEDEFDFRPVYLNHLDRPFRMAKLNLLWSKAVQRLTDLKLKLLFGELKLHDKEEITWKHLRAEGKDKDGLKEAELREKLTQIMANFNLLDQAEDISDPEKYRRFKAMNDAQDKTDIHKNKSLFTDKKLNKLWEKAEHAGFTSEELSALREEFQHHQDKIDQYYLILHDVKNNTGDNEENSIQDKIDRFNVIQTAEETPNKDYLEKVNLLRERNREIKDGYDRLYVIAAKGPASKEFVEPKVQGLWRMALEANFSPDELESLKVELLHYENRLLKLRHIQADAAINEEKYKKIKSMAGSKLSEYDVTNDQIKKHAKKVEKIHLDLEGRIMQKHIEL